MEKRDRVDDLLERLVTRAADGRKAIDSPLDMAAILAQMHEDSARHAASAMAEPTPREARRP